MNEKDSNGSSYNQNSGRPIRRKESGSASSIQSATIGAIPGKARIFKKTFNFTSQGGVDRNENTKSDES